MQKMTKIAIGVPLMLLAFAAVAAKPIAYPAKGQNAAQQNKDDGECYVWAKQNTGIDPANVSAAPQETGAAVGGGERAQGAVRGAVGGAVIGSIAGDTGKGAGIGAVVGTMRGGQRARQNQAARNQQAQNQQAQTVDTYYRAYGACMSGRGYTIM
jgi:Glycine zipper